MARERADDDRRVVRLRLTGRARPEMEQALARRTGQVREVCARLSPEEARGVARGMELLAEVLVRDAARQGRGAADETKVAD